MLEAAAAAAATGGYKYLLSGKKWEALNNSVGLEKTRGGDCTRILKIAGQLLSTRLPVEVSASRDTDMGGDNSDGGGGVPDEKTKLSLAPHPQELKAVRFKL